VELGSHAEPLSVGRQAVKLAQVGPGDPVLVYGVGPIGLYAIIALKLAGAGPIVAAGRSAGRRQAAADVGADVVIDTREISVAQYAAQAGALFAAVLECSAAPGAFNEALAVTEPGGAGKQPGHSCIVPFVNPLTVSSQWSYGSLNRPQQKWPADTCLRVRTEAIAPERLTAFLS